ncbi:hypothetical protein ANN_27572 [Periplaneta americana]|uniref:Uncharacterized protein n=1 Tax=Periplaneta americana TaxID=6978 RepID=A0ABQ8RW96_PERAM|nr:hypothetical protein ANN_27572 [Periplaneta americana]
MDVIKMEPDIHSLPMQSSAEEKKPLLEEGNLLDLSETRIKEECVDDSYNHTSEIKLEEIILPNNFPVMKCEVEDIMLVMTMKLISLKIQNHNKSMGTINRVLKPSLVQRHTRIRAYKTLARPMLTYGSEAWTICKRDINRITASEMKFMIITAGYTKLDKNKTVDILQDLQISSVMDHITTYRNNWQQHLQRMDRSRIPHQILNYHPRGKRYGRKMMMMMMMNNFIILKILMSADTSFKLLLISGI